MTTTYTRLLHFFQQYTKYCDHQFQSILERMGITMREVHVLLFLANNPEYDTARDITVLRGISKSQVSQAVDLLSAEGFLLRTHLSGRLASGKRVSGNPGILRRTAGARNVCGRSHHISRTF